MARFYLNIGIHAHFSDHLKCSSLKVITQESMGREACAQFVLLVETAQTLIMLWTVRKESTLRATPKFATRYPDSQITLNSYFYT